MATIELVKKNLFVSHAPVLAHGCNAVGKMGAGIAKQFAELYPQMYKAYAAQCNARQLNVGDVFLWFDENKVIANCITQPNIGKCATTQGIEMCMRKLCQIVVNNNYRHLSMPMIGCGLGGLNWRQVEPVIATEFWDWNGRIDIHVVNV